MMAAADDDCTGASWTRVGGLKFHFLRLEKCPEKLGKMSRKCQKKSPQNCTKNVPKIEDNFDPKIDPQKMGEYQFRP